MSDFITPKLITGLKYSATSSMCTRALAMLMASDYDENDIAQIAEDLFKIKVGLGRVK